MTAHVPSLRPAVPSPRRHAGSVPAVPRHPPRPAGGPPFAIAVARAAWRPLRVLGLAALQACRRIRLRARLNGLSDADLGALLISRAEIDAAVRDAFVLWPGHPRWIGNPGRKRRRRFR